MEMDFETKSLWLKRNPVTAVRHIDYMFQKFFHGVVIGAPHPIGQVLNFDTKKEFQGRGRVHFHIALHVKDAPQFGKNTEKEITDFVDQHISVRIPSESEDEDMHDLVTQLQMHSHSQTCRKKKNASCRFFFPKPPSPKTLLAHPPDAETDPVATANAQQVLQLVYNVMVEWNMAEPLTLHSLLQQAGVSMEMYIKSLRLSTKRHMVVLQREPKEQNVNNYNPLFLRAWRANMDIQLVLDTYACIMYVTSYLCKAEKTMSQLLQQASKQCKNRDLAIKEKLSVLGNVFLTHREISTDEAVCCPCHFERAIGRSSSFQLMSHTKEHVF